MKNKLMTFISLSTLNLIPTPLYANDDTSSFKISATGIENNAKFKEYTDLIKKNFDLDKEMPDRTINLDVLDIGKIKVKTCFAVSYNKSILSKEDMFTSLFKQSAIHNFPNQRNYYYSQLIDTSSKGQDKQTSSAETLLDSVKLSSNIVRYKDLKKEKVLAKNGNVEKVCFSAVFVDENYDKEPGIKNDSCVHLDLQNQNRKKISEKIDEKHEEASVTKTSEYKSILGISCGEITEKDFKKKYEEFKQHLRKTGENYSSLVYSGKRDSKSVEMLVKDINEAGNMNLQPTSSSRSR